MKKLSLFGLLSVFILISCQKDDTTVNAELPKWLKSKIEKDEQFANQNPKSMSAWGVWESSKYKGEIYFEYSNMVSSLAYYSPISFDQDTLSWEVHDDYLRMKCCSKVVWHGNMVDEETLNAFYGD
jgi:hypothetical protein